MEEKQWKENIETELLGNRKKSKEEIKPQTIRPFQI